MVVVVAGGSRALGRILRARRGWRGDPAVWGINDLDEIVWGILRVSGIDCWARTVRGFCGFWRSIVGRGWRGEFCGFWRSMIWMRRCGEIEDLRRWARGGGVVRCGVDSVVRKLGPVVDGSVR